MPVFHLESCQFKVHRLQLSCLLFPGNNCAHLIICECVNVGLTFFSFYLWPNECKKLIFLLWISGVHQGSTFDEANIISGCSINEESPWPMYIVEPCPMTTPSYKESVKGTFIPASFLISYLNTIILFIIKIYMYYVEQNVLWLPMRWLSIQVKPNVVTVYVYYYIGISWFW